jgi:aspartate-semialdehyde dehydrogenase
MSAKGDARIPVGVLGATGVVGQRMVRLLEDHPWFRLATVTASDRSAGRPYAEATRWIQSGPIPEAVAALPVRPTEPMAGVPLVFSALDSSVAGPLEERFAGAGILVVSNARNHRMDPRVPLLVPEVNPGHLDLLDGQEYPEGGGIITNPNCSTIGLSLVLGPLHAAFGVEAVHVVTLQALSGAGLPGHAALEMQDNVIPFISGEEEKLEAETLKILGVREKDGVEPARFPVSAQCTRVPVTDGHTEMVSVKFASPVTPEAAAEVLAGFRSLPQELGLPFAPRRPIHVLADERHPQPRLHRDLEEGMAVSVGRIRPCPVHDLRMVVLSHNTVRGAAGGALLCGELAVAEEKIPGVRPPVPTDDR